MNTWWPDLRSALDVLADQPTDRGDASQERVTGHLYAFFGTAVDPRVCRWVTSHRDLNWTNVTQPNLALLDWESWGVAPVGYDAATLAVLSLAAPETHQTVRATFADVLDSPDGVRAQLLAIARHLRRVEVGDLWHYVDHLHGHARRLLSV